MTPPTQDDLAAGRGLDAEIATKIMGWQRWSLDTRLGQIAPLRNPATGEINPPAYSTDIGAAWTVLEGWSVTLAHAEGLPWHCHLSKFDKSEGVWVNGEGHGDTAPLAICRAALAAVSSG